MWSSLQMESCCTKLEQSCIRRRPTTVVKKISSQLIIFFVVKVHYECSVTPLLCRRQFESVVPVSPLCVAQFEWQKKEEVHKLNKWIMEMSGGGRKLKDEKCWAKSASLSLFILMNGEVNLHESLKEAGEMETNQTR